MNILILGGKGFIGQHLCGYVQHAGHQVVLTSRNAGDLANKRGGHIKEAFTLRYYNSSEEPGEDLFEDIDVAINLIGILRETSTQRFRDIYESGPQALYTLANQSRIKRLLHVSALGASATARSEYHRSKFAGEQALQGRGFDYTVFRPSLVYGNDGDSTRLFKQLAALPFTPLIWAGQQQIQPVHIDDFCEAIVHWLEQPELVSGEIIDVVGSLALDMKQYYRLFRLQQGRGDHWLNLPEWSVNLAAKIGDYLPASPICSDTRIMLHEHNIGDGESFSGLLGRKPRAPESFFDVTQCH